MNIIKWQRPSGIPLETDDSKATVEYLESLGFERIKEKAKPRPKPKPTTDFK